MEGYKPVDVVLKRRLSGAVFWNLLLIPVGGAVGGTIGANTGTGWDQFDNAAVYAGSGVFLLPAVGFLGDFANGAAYKLKQTEISLALVPEDT